jgi:hypothetical protein
MYLILSAAIDPEDESASNRNENQEIFLGRSTWLTRKADNHTAIYEPTVQTMRDPQHLATV